MKSEMVDIFDENFDHIGIASRELAHAQGLWHQTFHCWLVRQDDTAKYLLFQRRGPEKDLYPDTLDITAAGHLLVTESPLDGVREIEEEIGIKIEFDQLINLGTRCEVIKIGSVVNREFCHTFLLESNCSLDSYKLAVDEVSSIVQIELNDGLNLFSGGIDSVNATGFQVQSDGAKKLINITVTRDDVIPRLGNYYLSIFGAAKRYFQGEQHLTIA